MDPLSDVLSLLKPRSYMFRGLDAGGSWSLQFPAHPGMRCYAIVSGHCWLVVDDMAAAIRLAPGDCVLLTREQSFRLAADPTLPPVDAMTFFSAVHEGGVATCNGGGDVTGMGGYFKFEGQHASLLLQLLPPVVHIRNESDRSVLRSSIERMMQELRNPQPGGFLLAQHLAHVMLLLALRLHLADGAKAGGVGWLFALADKQMSAAINAMHADPAQPWTLQTLAQRACMSRSSFALKFKSTVGTAPMEYMTRWRMLLAAHKLANSHESVSVIAASLGYESDSAFSTTFKRSMGATPSAYRRLDASRRIDRPIPPTP